MRGQLAKFEIGRKFDPMALYDLQIQMSHLPGSLIEILSSTIQPAMTQCQTMADHIYSFIEALDSCGLKESLEENIRSLETMGDLLLLYAKQDTPLGGVIEPLASLALKLKDKLSLHPAYWEKLFSDIPQYIREAINKLEIFSGRRWYIHFDELFNVNELFEPGDFEHLPDEAKDDFEEAALCYFFEQFTAAVMLSYRATEAMLCKYYCHVTGHETTEQTWEWILGELENIASKLGGEVVEELGLGKRRRNRFAHPSRSEGKTGAKNASDYLRGAVTLCGYLITDLKRMGKLLTVHVQKPLNFDKALALWIIDQKGNGIGRCCFFAEHEVKYTQSSTSEIIIGGSEGEFQWVTNPDEASIARRAAKRYQLEGAHENLLNFVEQLHNNQYRGFNVPLVESEAPQETLEMILESLYELYGENTRNCLDLSLKIIRVIHRLSLNPFDPNIARHLADKGTNWLEEGFPDRIICLIERAEARLKEREAEVQHQSKYNEQDCLIVVTRNLLSQERYDQTFPYLIACDTNNGELKITYHGKAPPDLKHIYRVLKARHYEATYRYQELYVKGKEVKNLSAAQLIEIIEEAEKDRKERGIGFQLSGRSRTRVAARPAYVARGGCA